MMLIKNLLPLILLLAMQSVVAQTTAEKEIVIVGTMHYVPNVIKYAYKPMYKKAKKYAPDNIYVEYVPKNDRSSIEFDTPEFLYLSDSMQAVVLDIAKVNELLSSSLKSMNVSDFELLRDYFMMEADYANYCFYKYLVKYGIEGKKKPSQDENGDVSFKLAIEQDFTRLKSMDFQSSNKEYYKYWRACDSTYIVEEKMDLLAKKQKKLYRNAVIGTLIMGNARGTNRVKSLESFHEINSLRYEANPVDVCKEGTKYWDLRNEKMADNIAKQVIEGDEEKNLVVVGAGHVVGLIDILKQKYPDLNVRTLY